MKTFFSILILTVSVYIQAHDFALRLATNEDIPVLTELIRASVTELQVGYYTQAQREGALASVYGVDTQLINDGTYFVVECGSEIVGCGGWSRWKKLFGSDGVVHAGNGLLDPAYEPAKIRAFFVHPSWARKGIGRILLRACEEAAYKAGFTKLEMAATLPGVPLYSACGYKEGDHFSIALSNGEQLPLIRMYKHKEL